jgi:hypothetical protein
MRHMTFKETTRAIERHQTRVFTALVTIYGEPHREEGLPLPWPNDDTFGDDDDDFDDPDDDDDDEDADDDDDWDVLTA